jgi:nucleotide-binding universal stress UspA family protein
MAECILNERGKKDYGTIVVGRQGISRKEAFLFGSVSSKIVNHAKDCSVWVVG